MLPITTILCPTDFSPHAEAAFQLGSALARDYQAKLILLHVVHPATNAFVDGVMVPIPETDLDAVRDHLHHWHADSPTSTERVLVEGEVLQEILRVAEDRGCDLIVMGTHGRGPLRQLLMGGTAEGVVRKAPCPVMTIKPQAHHHNLPPAGQPAESVLV